MPLVLVGLVAVSGGADAGHKKPVSKPFTVTGTVPFPSGGGRCETAPHGKDRHVETFKAPEAGKFAAELTGFVGDYDMVVTNEAGTVVLSESDNGAGTSSGNPSTGTAVEKISYTVKKPMTIQLHVCNYAAGPTATGKYTFTYAR